METLERVLARHPYDRGTLSALVAYSREQGNPRQALSYVRCLAELEPANPELRQLMECLEAEARRNPVPGGRFRKGGGAPSEFPRRGRRGAGPRGGAGS